MNAGAQKMIARMGLEPLSVEGGFYRRTWLSPELRSDGRPTGSHIWYLVTGVKSLLSAILPLRAKILGDDEVIDVIDVDAQDCA